MNSRPTSEASADSELVKEAEEAEAAKSKARRSNPRFYFMNTKTHRAHMRFMAVANLPRGGRGTMREVLSYRPLLMAPNGERGLFTFEFEPFDSFPFDMVKIAFDLLCDKSPLLRGRLAFRPMPGAMPRYEEEKAKYAAAKLPVFHEDDRYSGISFLPLNVAESFGRLRVMKATQRPGPRDIVLYPTLPNEMPRVAGIITAVRQTPLSHVNLRAIQDGVPNAFITAATKHAKIAPLIGKYVYYKVTRDAFHIREASTAEVDAHFAHVRPKKAQVPKRDLKLQKILSLDDLEFADDAASVGVKAANLATLRTLGFAKGAVPEGYVSLSTSTTSS